VRRTQIAVPVVLLLLLIAACGGGQESAAPTASPRTSPPVSATQTPSIPAPTGTPSALGRERLSKWEDCGRGFDCATLTVLLDQAKPDLGTIGLAVTRHPATGDRIGALVVNPGGPGASAVDYVKDAYSQFPSAIRDRFDIVAFDPRGVGHTSPVRCLSTGELDAYFHIDPYPDSQAEVAAVDAGNKKLADGCLARSGKVLPYASTAIVAQDLERVRIAIGEPKLTYLGYSYGTAIGAAYLDRFPTHVRAMVLDGAIDPALTWDGLLAGQARGFEVALNSFLNDCEKTSCEFRKAVKGNLFEEFDKIAKGVESKALHGDGSRTVGPSEFSLGVGAGLYSRANGWPAVAQALASAANGEGDVLLALNDSYLERSDKGYANIIEANNAVNCIDRPWPRTDAPYFALAKEVGKDSPRFGPIIAVSGLSCSVWPIKPAEKPHQVKAPGSPTVLVIGTTRDPATPYSWAQALAKQLSRGVLLTHDGDGHTVYRTAAPRCILRPVNDYLISLTPPKPATC
jgi:pimeloyl-ACP methyl ester carboxylesterase